MLTIVCSLIEAQNCIICRRVIHPFFRSQLPVCCSTYASIHEKGMRNNKMPMAAVCLRFPTTACQLPIVTPSAACLLSLTTPRQTRACASGPIGVPARARESNILSGAQSQNSNSAWHYELGYKLMVVRQSTSEWE